MWYLLGNLTANITKKVLLDLAVPLAKVVLPKLTKKVTSSVLDKFERKVIGQETIRAGKTIHFIHSK